MPIFSYLLASFHNFLEEILTHNFWGIEVGLKLFFIWSLEMVVGPLWKDGIYTLGYSCCWGYFDSMYLHITIACLGPIWKHVTCTLQLLLVAPLLER